VILELSATVNDFLATAAAVVRDRFGGRITYAAVPLERIDWEGHLPGPAAGAEGRVHRGRRVVPVNAS